MLRCSVLERGVAVCPSCDVSCVCEQNRTEFIAHVFIKTVNSAVTFKMDRLINISTKKRITRTMLFKSKHLHMYCRSTRVQFSHIRTHEVKPSFFISFLSCSEQKNWSCSLPITNNTRNLCLSRKPVHFPPHGFSTRFNSISNGME